MFIIEQVFVQCGEGCGATARPRRNQVGSETQDRCYICVDLKSFYASVECVDRGLDPLEADLVVADPSRGRGTICLAVSVALKAKGVRNRCRVFEIPEGLKHITAVPRMRRYLDASSEVLACVLGLVAPDDVHPYSVDECFIDATPYLRLYRTDGRGLARMLIDAVRRETGLPATAGVGTNMYLAKVALDIMAKHAADGIGALDEAAYHRELWFHRPLTDFWGVGPGTARRLARHGIVDMAGVCAADPGTLKREFGVQAEWLIDHAWGLEPCTIAEAKGYAPKAHSISSGQVLMRDYSKAEGTVVVREMADAAVLELVEKGLLCDGVSLYVGFSGRDGAAVPERARRGRRGSGVGHGRRLEPTRQPSVVVGMLMRLYDECVPEGAAVRRFSVGLATVEPGGAEQLSLFGDGGQEERERHLAEATLEVHGRFGKNALLKGTSLKGAATGRERNRQIGGHRA